ncbi:MAG TPA: hypothetical protein VF867_12065, partial [Arthrobacter sp.]
LDQSAHEDRNLLLAARLLVAAARQRTGSVGAHYRADADTAAACPAVPAAPALLAAPAVLAAPAGATPATGPHSHRHAPASRPKQRISS